MQDDTRAAMWVTSDPNVAWPAHKMDGNADIGAYEFDGDYIFANGFD